MKALGSFSLVAAALVTAPSVAEARMLLSGVQTAEASSALMVEVTQLNTASGAQILSFPERIPGTLSIAQRNVPVELVRAADAAPSHSVPAGGFAQARYALALPEGHPPSAAALLSLVGQDTPGLAFSLPALTHPTQTAQTAEGTGSGTSTTVGAAEGATETPPAQTAVLAPAVDTSPRPDTGNLYIGNLSSYAPIYAAYGPGTNTEIRLQFSLKYQLFGDPGAVGPGHSLLNGIHFGYTQRMFWDWSAKSSPFRNIDFMPEIFYLVPAQHVTDGISLGGQFGLRHASNGKDGEESRSINTIYFHPVASTALGGGYRLSVGPTVEFYVGSLKDNPDIKRYRGNTGLFLEIDDADGLRLSTETRYSFKSGRASVNAELSYPFDRIIDTSLNLYLFGQFFTGYGETLLDYNRQDTRLRIGFAIVR
ncbi:MAG TPA: phospholipase A [Pedomonas sp.]|uniref:phospholipase A n=1 Tax=Pedomonas sp. TaxID=2976421 RepID=UPI002F422797